MKKLLYLISFIPSFLFAGFTTDNLVATSTFTLRTSTMVINGTTYYWRAGSGNNGECLTTDGAVTPALTFGTCGGGGITPGSTYYIQNTNDLQSGATFYVSSGTVHGNFNIYPSSNSRTNYLNFNTTFADDFFDSKYLNQRAYIPNSDGSYGGLGYRIIASTNIVSSTVNQDPVILMNLSNTGNGILASVGNSYLQITGGYSPVAILTNGTDIIGMDETNGAYVAASSFTVYSHVGPGNFRIRDGDGGDNYVTLKASSSMSSDLSLTLPSVDGTNGQVLTTNGSGVLSFATVSGGGSGTTVRVENQGSFAVNSSTFNFDRGLLATNDVGEAKIQLDPSTYIGNQSWSDGASDTTIDVVYNIFGGTPPQWSYTDNNISTLNDLALPNLDPSQPLKLDGSQVIISDPINLSDTTNEVTGVLPGSNLGSGSTNYIQNTGTLQSNATFYVSSGTATNFTSSNLTASNITATNITGTNILVTNLLANFGAAYRVPYLSAANIFTTDANFFFADFAQILYGPSILSTVQMGAYNGATVVAYDNDSTNFVGLKSSAALTANNTYVLPASSGTSAQAILTDGANNLYFGSVAPLSGATTYIQNTNSLQTGATFYVSSGTALSMNVSTFSVTRQIKLPYLSPGVLHVQATSSNVVTGLVSLSTEVTGALRYSNIKFNRTFNSEQAKLPTSNPCVISNAGALTIPAILCDASTDESATWSTLLTEYTTTTMRADIYYTMASATSGNVVHNISVMCASTTYTSDLDTESFGSVNASTFTVPSVAGRLGVATMTLTNMDTGCVQNGFIIFKYTRDANSASDTASGDIEIRKIWAREP